MKTCQSEKVKGSIESHTVPQSLLRRFAYLDPNTGSLRLWRYAKERPPFNNASPKSAARYKGHFVDPDNAEAEKEIEDRLAHEFENPVNHFVHRLGEPDFTRTDEHRKQLTNYVSLLFRRSKARREGTKHLQEVKRRALEQFLNNPVQLLTVAASWNIELVCRGIRMSKFFTPEDISRITIQHLKPSSEADSEQGQYIAGIRTGMANLDEEMYHGEWKLLTTTPDRPFIISDAPVVTWQRGPDGMIHHGGGFQRPNVEVLLPVSPTACLHIYPDVERTAPIMSPTTEQVNIAQAAFAYRDCFCNVRSDEIDGLVQRHISTARIGKDIFTIWHRDYSSTVMNMMMALGKWLQSSNPNGVNVPNYTPKPYEKE